MFRSRSQFLDWIPTEGDKIEVRAQATLYETRGDYQLIIDAMRHAGQGNLYEEFLRLKANLEADGLFRTESKLSLPPYPKQVGIITSLQAAALQDVLRTMELRWPGIPVVIYPTAVQGFDAAEMINQNLQIAIKRKECDVLLLVRGGGSLDDMHPFNDEKIARTIYSSTIPIVTGIGHETDFCIADFVADKRAATPTAAVQIAMPDQAEVKNRINTMKQRLNQARSRQIQHRAMALDDLTRRLTHPREFIIQQHQNINQLTRLLPLNLVNLISNSIQKLANNSRHFASHRPNFSDLNEKQEILRSRLNTACNKSLRNMSIHLNNLTESIEHLNPNRVLKRGYCITKNDRGETIISTESITLGSKIEVIASWGRIGAKVIEISNNP